MVVEWVGGAERGKGSLGAFEPHPSFSLLSNVANWDNMGRVVTQTRGRAF